MNVSWDAMSMTVGTSGLRLGWPCALEGDAFVPQRIPYSEDHPGADPETLDALFESVRELCVEEAVRVCLSGGELDRYVGVCAPRWEVVRREADETRSRYSELGELWDDVRASGMLDPGRVDEARRCTESVACFNGTLLDHARVCLTQRFIGADSRRSGAGPGSGDPLPPELSALAFSFGLETAHGWERWVAPPEGTGLPLTLFCTDSLAGWLAALMIKHAVSFSRNASPRLDPVTIRALDHPVPMSGRGGRRLLPSEGWRTVRDQVIDSIGEARRPRLDITAGLKGFSFLVGSIAPAMGTLDLDDVEVAYLHREAPGQIVWFGWRDEEGPTARFSGTQAERDLCDADDDSVVGL